MIRIAHISDLHFSKIILNPLKLCSKRWIGYLNLLLNRKKVHRTSPLKPIPDLFKELNVNLVLVTGDISTTSLVSEFKMAKKLFDEIKKQGMEILFLPGNHDQYTKRAFSEKTFYKFFENKCEKFPLSHYFSLKKDGVEVRKLFGKWWYVGIDTAVATKLLSSQGLFSEKVEKTLIQALEKIPKEDSILLVNHFPFFKMRERTNLVRRENLKNLIQKWPNIRLYLHGHTHRNLIADLRKNDFPIIMDSGSISHHSRGTWNLLDLDSEKCNVEIYKWKNRNWESSKKESFSWQS